MNNASLIRELRTDEEKKGRGGNEVAYTLRLTITLLFLRSAAEQLPRSTILLVLLARILPQIKIVDKPVSRLPPVSTSSQ